MTDHAKRISVAQAHQDLASDPGALLVCAYDDAAKFEQNHLAGAIPLDEFEARAAALPKDREIIFYCA